MGPLTHSPEAVEMEWGPREISVTHCVLRPLGEMACEKVVLD